MWQDRLDGCDMVQDPASLQPAEVMMSKKWGLMRDLDLFPTSFYYIILKNFFLFFYPNFSRQSMGLQRLTSRQHRRDFTQLLRPLFRHMNNGRAFNVVVHAQG